MSAPLGNKNAEGNEGGRPTKMPEDLIERAQAYLSQCIDNETEFHKTRGEKSDSYERIKKVNIPSIAGLARWLDVSRETIYEWQKAKIEFSDICEKILAEQEKRLLDNGLAGEYQPNITKLLLTKHGYTDKADITSDGKAISISFDEAFKKNAV